MGIHHVPKPILILFLFGFCAGAVVTVTSYQMALHGTWGHAPDWMQDMSLILCPMLMLEIGIPLDSPAPTLIDYVVMVLVIAFANGAFFGGIGALIDFFQKKIQAWNHRTKAQ